MSTTLRKAVIPAAGFGTRFLPATRTVPKVMLPIFDTPAIHFAVEEAARSGAEHIVLVVSRGQEAVGDYFGRLPELEQALERRGQTTLLQRMVEVSHMAEISCVYQEQQFGLGHAVLMARSTVGNEPFAVLLPDDIIRSETPTITEMTKVFDEHGGSVVAVKQVPDEAVSSLGIVDERPIDDRVSRIVGMVEKPSVGEAPSNLAVVGRYVLTPEVFELLTAGRPGALGEIQLTDAIGGLLSTQGVYAYRFPGRHFDVGTPLGALQASAYAALQRDGISGDFRTWLAGVL